MVKTIKVTNVAELIAAKKNETIPDDLNPAYLLSQFPNDILADILSGNIDVKLLVRDQLASRGMDKEGKWIGFDQAAKLHRVK